MKKLEAYALIDMDLELLCQSADELRALYCQDAFDLCTIINGKSGACSENCKFCAQSAHYTTEIETYSLLDQETIARVAAKHEQDGILRFSIVTSGKAMSQKDLDAVCQTYEVIKQTSSLKLCASHGLLTKSQLQQLRDSGVTRYHNNLETSRNYFNQICTTHSYDDKIATIKAALEVGLIVCSGGIIGMGESMKDRIDLAFELRELGIKSIPINILNPIPNTPLGHLEVLSEDEIRRTVAIFRHIIPEAAIRLAGGRGLLKDKGESLFKSGANAAISGDMLTTSGVTTQNDIKLIKKLGYEVSLI